MYAVCTLLQTPRYYTSRKLNVPKTCGKPWRRLQMFCFVFFHLFLKGERLVKIQGKKFCSKPALTFKHSHHQPHITVLAPSRTDLEKAHAAQEQVHGDEIKPTPFPSRHVMSHRQRAGKMALWVKRLAPQADAEAHPWRPTW